MDKDMLRSSRPNHNYRYDTVNLRIETNLTTLYEGLIYSGPRNITMDNATALCNSQGAGYSNPGSPPSNTPTDALDAAAKARGFAYFGYYNFVYNDFLMTTIAGVENWGDGKTYLFWGSLVNYQVSFYGDGLPMSGCSQLANPGDDVLWAYQAVGPSFNDDINLERSYLKISPTTVTVRRGQGFTVTVIDGRTGNLTQNATVAGFKTDAKGRATIRLHDTGFFQFKAERPPDVRSNVMNVTVTK